MPAEPSIIHSSAPARLGLQLRAGQREVLSYRGGRAGISAVPGSGKTLTLGLLACELIQELARRGTLDRQEVLIVTFSRTAVQNFRSRLNQLMATAPGAMPGTGYAVRTLHSLAHEIVRTRPSVVNLDDEFAVVEERPAKKLLAEAVAYVSKRQPELLASYYKPDLMVHGSRHQGRARRDMEELAAQMLREAKQLRLDPTRLDTLMKARDTTRPLLDFTLQVYQRYQQVLTAEHALDYDDLMRLAVDIVEADDDLCTRLQARWPFVLEDEAQDSSLLQEALLSRLTAQTSNWVRMGDPNQAISTSFNGSTPGQLRKFLRSPATRTYALAQSGRCHAQIMEWANNLIQWSARQVQGDCRLEGLVYPLIEPTSSGDPQPNPEGGQPVYLTPHTLTLHDADAAIVKSIGKFVRGPEGKTRTVAVLAPTNHRGNEMAKQLLATGIAVDDSLLQVSHHTTEQIRKLAVALGFVVNPDLQRVRLVWREIWQEELVATWESAEEEEIQPLPARWQQLGAFLEASWQRHAFLEDWMETLAGTDNEGEPLPSGLRRELARYRGALQRWSTAVVLPIDEVILMLGQDLFRASEDLALAHRVALHLGDRRRQDPSFSLQDCQRELRDLAAGRSRQAGLLQDAALYEAVPGRVTVSTYHSAKGLEWDRVYLVGVNDFEFPWDPDRDSFRGMHYYVRDRLNLAAEGRAMLQEIAEPDLDPYVPGVATQQSKCQTVDEKLRLLYVGITRARLALGIYCDSGTREQNNRPQALAALEPVVAQESAQSSVAVPFPH